MTLSDAIVTGFNDPQLSWDVEKAVVRALIAMGSDKAILNPNGTEVFYVRNGELAMLQLVIPSPEL